jgi:hypothetical protein
MRVVVVVEHIPQVLPVLVELGVGVLVQIPVRWQQMEPQIRVVEEVVAGEVAMVLQIR